MKVVELRAERAKIYDLFDNNNQTSCKMKLN